MKAVLKLLAPLIIQLVDSMAMPIARKAVNDALEQLAAKIQDEQIKAMVLAELPAMEKLAEDAAQAWVDAELKAILEA